MIRYDLQCSQGHAFDGWFANSDAYDRQIKLSLVTCPYCGTAEVEKAIMAPRIASSEREEAQRPETLLATAAPSAELAEMMALLHRLRKHIEETAENVGPRFAEEARKIHYEEAERRNIYGEATPEDAKALMEEGIEFHFLPRLPDDAN